MYWSATLVIVGFALLFILLETWIPYNRNETRIYKGIWSDLVFYAILQPLILGQVIVFAGHALAHYFETTGWRFFYLNNWSLPAQIALFVLTHDFVMYWIHRWQHASPNFWKLHEAHHSPQHLNWISGVRSHPLEFLLLQTIEFLPLYILGASPEIVPYKAALDAVTGQWIHANVWTPLGPLGFVLNGPCMHRWHHVDTPEVYHRNFATKLALWDWVFGTALLPKERSSCYGLKAGVREIYPNDYVGQVLFLLLRRIPRSVHRAKS